MRLPGTDRILFGGDYNPEQWPEETWEEDMRLFREAHVSELTVNVFSWALLQPSEEEFDFHMREFDTPKYGIRILSALIRRRRWEFPAIMSGNSLGQTAERWWLPLSLRRKRRTGHFTAV